MIGSLSQKKSSSVGRSIANVGWIFFDRIFRVMASLLVGVWVARYLGPEDYGQWSYAMAFPGILNSVAGLGLASIVTIRLTQRGEGTVQQILGTSFALRLLSGSICCLIIVISSYWLHHEQLITHYLILLTSVTLITQSFEVVDIFFQTQIKAKKSVLAKTIAFFVSTLFKVVLLSVKAPLFWFVSTTAVEGVLGALFITFIYNRDGESSIRSWRFDSVLALQLVKASWPLMVSDFFIFVYMRIDQIMIKQLTTSAELGRYSAALKLSESWYFIAGAIVTSFYPTIAKLYAEDKETFYKKYQQILNLLAFVALAIALMVSVVAPLLTSILYGNKYDGVATILSIHVWTGVPIFLGVGCSNLFILKNLQKLVFFRTAVGAGINVVLNLLLIPKYGAVGASVATLVAQLFASVLLNLSNGASKPIFKMQIQALMNGILLKFNKKAILSKFS